MTNKEKFSPKEKELLTRLYKMEHAEDEPTNQQELMDGYDIVRQDKPSPFCSTLYTWIGVSYRVYRYERPKVGKPVKVYKFGYPDYKSMIEKHPELEILQLSS